MLADVVGLTGTVTVHVVCDSTAIDDADLSDNQVLANCLIENLTND